jgi:hypothetical protein
MSRPTQAISSLLSILAILSMRIERARYSYEAPNSLRYCPNLKGCLYSPCRLVLAIPIVSIAKTDAADMQRRLPEFLQRNQAFHDVQLDTLPAQFRQKIAKCFDFDRGDGRSGDPHASVMKTHEVRLKKLITMQYRGPKSVKPRPFYVCDHLARSRTPPSLMVFRGVVDVGQYKTRGHSRGNRYIDWWSSSMVQTSGSFSHSRPAGLSVGI